MHNKIKQLHTLKQLPQGQGFMRLQWAAILLLRWCGLQAAAAILGCLDAVLRCVAAALLCAAAHYSSLCCCGCVGAAVLLQRDVLLAALTFMVMT